MSTQNNAFFYVTTFEIFTLAGIYLFLKLENFWELIDNIFDEDAILSVSKKSFRGSVLIRKIISFVGIRNASKIFSTLSFLVATTVFIYIAFYMHVSWNGQYIYVVSENTFKKNEGNILVFWYPKKI